ncbi:hypothetical protein Misp01_46300 [Microtetraspora sp. NBRC 13810]|nr:hypothetical protein Misp01_46300 [Microtetraspora sp. NBRC 13810]
MIAYCPFSIFVTFAADRQPAPAANARPVSPRSWRSARNLAPKRTRAAWADEDGDEFIKDNHARPGHPAQDSLVRISAS